MQMLIPLVITPAFHRRQVKAQHSTIIYFLSPRLINNSWALIVGGASLGEGGDTSKTEGGSLSLNVGKKTCIKVISFTEAHIHGYL